MMRASSRSYATIALTVLIAVEVMPFIRLLQIKTTTAFVSPTFQRYPRPFGNTNNGMPRSSSSIVPKTTGRVTHNSRLCMSVVEDPFQVLLLSPTADAKEIKRAYKRMALKYHPDVVTNPESSVEERKKANDDFAKINWAYAQLSGKNNGGTTTSSSSRTSSSSTSRSSYNTPPHRRTSSSTYNPNQASTDWRDYMPKYDDDANYDAGGDSFEKILSDLLKGAAVGAAGVAGSGGGVFRDFVEFLESNVDGYSSGAAKEEDDAQLRILLTTGSVEEVGMEMDDTELVVQQLDSKRSNLADELIMRQADRKIASGYMEKMELDEKVAELEARKQVVDAYLKKARKRLLSLQTRYKQLIVGGENDNFARKQQQQSSSSNTWDGQSQSSSPGASSSRGTSSGTSTTSSSAAASMEEDAWKHEGFGSSGRGRGSSSRRSRGSSQTRQSSTSSSTTQPPSPASQQTRTSRAQSSSSTASAAQSPPTNKSPPRSFSDTPSQPWTPPHRRTASTETQAREDKKRLRELQVDDAFDQLKKDLGL